MIPTVDFGRWKAGGRYECFVRRYGGRGSILCLHNARYCEMHLFNLKIKIEGRGVHNDVSAEKHWALGFPLAQERRRPCVFGVYTISTPLFQLFLWTAKCAVHLIHLFSIKLSTCFFPTFLRPGFFFLHFSRGSHFVYLLLLFIFKLSMRLTSLLQCSITPLRREIELLQNRWFAFATTIASFSPVNWEWCKKLL